MPARARGPSSTHPPAKARAAKPAPKAGAQTSSANSSYQQMRVAAERRSLPRDAGGIVAAEPRPGGPVSPGLSTEQSAAIVREVSEGYAAISSMREATMRRREQVAQLAPRPPRA